LANLVWYREGVGLLMRISSR